MKLSRVTIVALIGLRLLAVLLISAKADEVAARGKSLGLDTSQYHERVTAEGTPYRDFNVEFPPVTLGELRAVRGSTPVETGLHLAWAQFLLDGATLLVIGLVWGSAALGAYLLLTALFAPFMFLQVEPLVVALVVFALAGVELRRDRLGGTLLAVAAFAKVWPIVLIPILAARGKWQAVRYCLTTGILGLAAWMWWAGPSAPVMFFRYLSSGGWEVGSVVGTFVGLFTKDPIVVAAGTNRVESVPLWASVFLLATALVAAGAAALRTRRGGSWEVAAFFAVGALVLLSPIFSPQYVLWLVPFAAISGKPRLLAVAGIAVAVNLLQYVYWSWVGPNEGPVLYAILLAKHLGTALAVAYAGMMLVRESQASRADGLVRQAGAG